jgi:hypothetical protein
VLVATRIEIIVKGRISDLKNVSSGADNLPVKNRTTVDRRLLEISIDSRAGWAREASGNERNRGSATRDFL